MRHHRERGSLLTVAMALLLILMTLLAALKHYEQISRRATRTADSELQLVCSRKWELGSLLNKLPTGATRPSSLKVEAGLKATASPSTQIPDRFAEKLWETDDGVWDGLPNMLIERTSDVNVTAAPPGFKRYEGTDTSSDHALNVFGNRHETALSSVLPPYAAYAPNGNITLDGVRAWANPKMDGPKKPLTLNSGLPTVVAAGNGVNVTEFAYGTAVVKNKPASGKAIHIGTLGVGVPMVTRFPAPQFESTLRSAVERVKANLTARARSLDDRSQFIDGRPISLSGLLTGTWDPSSWTSLKSALEFKFPTIPGFSQGTPKGPVYCCFQFWFHAPYPPDGTDDGSEARGILEKYSGRIEQLERDKAAIDSKIKALEGAQVEFVNTRPNSEMVLQPDGSYAPATTGANINAPMPLGSPAGADGLHHGTVNNHDGLIPRKRELQNRLRSDLAYLKDKRANGVTTRITSGLQTDNSLIFWLTDYGIAGALYDNRDEDEGWDWSSEVRVGHKRSELDGFRSTPPVLPPKRHVEKWVEEDDPKEKGKKIKVDRGYDVQDPAPPPPSNEIGQMVINTVQWSTWDEFPPPPEGEQVVDVNSGSFSSQPTRRLGERGETDTFFHWNPGHPDYYKTYDNANPGLIEDRHWAQFLRGSYGAWVSTEGINEQIALFELLLDPSNSNNPFNRVENWLPYWKGLKTRVEKDLSDQKKALNDEMQELQSRFDNPNCRARDNGDEDGLDGFCYSRYGYSFDLIFNLINDLASGGFDRLTRRWENPAPLVWYGYPNTVLGAALSVDSLRLTGTFTVPQNRCFYYDKRMDLTGDLWLQRGSTMYVRGPLTLYKPAVSGASAYNPFVPSGRIILEEGASLIVGDDLTIEGTPERGSVLVTSPYGQVHPVSTAIMATGQVKMPYGIMSAYGFTDLLPAIPGVGKAANRVLTPTLGYVAPNLGKIWGPFHRRLPFFCKNCPQYELQIFIGPFFIPIPVIYPYPLPRDNVWIPVYRGLSLFYSTVNNFQLGEYLYPQCDWWFFSEYGGCGVVPVLPKLNPRTVMGAVDNLVSDIPDVRTLATEWIKDYFNSLLEYLRDQLVKDIIRQVIASAVPAEANSFVQGLIRDAVREVTGMETDFDGADLGDTIKDKIMGPLIKLKTEIENEVSKLASDALAYEVAGVLVYGSSIQVGMKDGAPVSPRPRMASGMFLASGDINLNVDHTVGVVISSNGSINPPDSGAHTTLLYYPAFGRVSLYLPSSSRTSLVGTPGWLSTATAYEYGTLGNPRAEAEDIMDADVLKSWTKVMVQGSDGWK